jgi:hypothetical protein
MSFTILDYLSVIEERRRPQKVPYIWRLEDSEEWDSGNYLKTKESFKRVITQIAKDKNLTTKSRIRTIVDKRKYLFYIAWSKGRLNYSEIGRIFDRDHATVIHGIKSYQEIKNFEDFKQSTEELRRFFINFEPLKY